jgi:hypothetical protein
MTEEKWLVLASKEYQKLIDCSPGMADDLAHSLLYDIYEGDIYDTDPVDAVYDDLQNWGD